METEGAKMMIQSEYGKIKLQDGAIWDGVSPLFLLDVRQEQSRYDGMEVGIDAQIIEIPASNIIIDNGNDWNYSAFLQDTSLNRHENHLIVLWIDSEQAYYFGLCRLYYGEQIGNDSVYESMAYVSSSYEWLRLMLINGERKNVAKRRKKLLKKIAKLDKLLVDLDAEEKGLMECS